MSAPFDGLVVLERRRLPPPPRFAGHTRAVLTKRLGMPEEVARLIIEGAVEQNPNV